MTIFNTSTSFIMNIDNVINNYIDRRCGYYQEDDIVFTVRMFNLRSVNTQTEQDPNDPTIQHTIKSISFNESEIEYEYWYSKYGVKLDGKPFGIREVGVYDEDRNEVNHSSFFTYNRFAQFDTSDTYEQTMKFLINQSAMASDENYTEYVRDMYEIVCMAFKEESEAEACADVMNKNLMWKILDGNYKITV